jgi:AmmeMemoRadiSam system radical SAM enzyme/AmmeMemoRadiSam system protein B/AmmeMemoRadiSam system protein A
MARNVTSPPDPRPGPDGVKAGGWWHEAKQSDHVVCDLCPRGCVLGEGARGFCFVRQNLGGQMVSTTYGRSTGFCVDPIEKKPLNHFYPGSPVLSFGTAGCNLGCKFCQNWSISKSREVASLSELAEPEAIAEAAGQLHCRSVAFTYNDPIIWAEYAIDTAQACRAAGVKTVAVTSGYITPAARGPFFAAMDAANVDLKGFSEDFYWKLTGGHLEPVKDTLRWLARETNVWLEITNLIIPHANDSPDELERMCAWIVEELGPDVPVHFTAFHPDFRMRDCEPTPPETLNLAHDLARRAGLRYPYTGNVYDNRRQSTYCPGCGRVLIERDGYNLGLYALVQDRCRHCGTQIAGRFDEGPGDWGSRRLPVRIAAYARPQPAQPEKESRMESPQANRPEPQQAAMNPPLLSEAQKDVVFQAAGRRVAAAVCSQPAERLDEVLADVAECPVLGAFVSLKRAGQLRSCCGFLTPSVPLYRALDHAAVRAAKDDPRFPPIGADELAQLDMEVWLLWGQTPVSAQGDDRLRAVVIGKHGLQIQRGSARGLLLPGVAVEHKFDARMFLEQVCRKAGLPRDAWLLDDTQLWTFEGYSIRGPLRSCLPPATAAAIANEPIYVGLSFLSPRPHVAVSNMPPPSVPPAVRAPAVAGRFYPGNPDELQKTISALLPVERQPESWAGAMVPHAGWMYSGRLAAAVFNRLQFPSRTIVVAPKHHRDGADWAVAPYRAWALPGGHVESDPELAQQLAQAVTGLELDARAHAREHSIEVQLPLIARVAPATRVVGIALHGGDLFMLQRFADQLAGVLSAMAERPLLVISTDMNHYASDDQTRRIDQLALAAIEALDPARLLKTVADHRISMCGVVPAVVVMETLRRLGSLHRVERVGYATSADASGDKSQCVGYAGYLFA